MLVFIHLVSAQLLMGFWNRKLPLNSHKRQIITHNHTSLWSESYFEHYVFPVPFNAKDSIPSQHSAQILYRQGSGVSER